MYDLVKWLIPGYIYALVTKIRFIVTREPWYT